MRSASRHFSYSSTCTAYYYIYHNITSNNTIAILYGSISYYSVLYCMLILYCIRLYRSMSYILYEPSLHGVQKVLLHDLLAEILARPPCIIRIMFKDIAMITIISIMIIISSSSLVVV